MTTFTVAPSSGVPYADALLANAKSDFVISQDRWHFEHSF